MVRERTQLHGERWLTRQRVAVLTVIFLLAVVLQRLFFDFASRHGLNITGDEPAYVMQAQAMLHGTLHILPTIKHDLASRVFPTTYPAHATPANVEAYSGPTGIVSPFDPGLGLLLVPFVAILAPATGGVIGMIALGTAAIMWLHQRLSKLLRLDVLSELTLAVVFAGPAILIAASQIYPDLMAGFALGVALVELAYVEMTRRVTWLSIVVFALGTAFAPWLQPKNLVPSVLLLLAGTYVFARRAGRLGAAVGIGVVCCASYGALLAFNVHYFGHPLGLPEPGPKLSREGAGLTLGLLFDRDQGLLIQVPYCLIGLVALVAYGRRRIGVTALTAVVLVLSVLTLNGSYTANPYGGLSPAGRFMWTIIPLSLPWVALVLERMMELRKPIGVALGLVSVAWVLQVEPILAGHHSYYNLFGSGATLWPTWWPGLQRFLPKFASSTHVLGSPGWAVALEILVDGLVLGGIFYWLRRPLQRSRGSLQIA